MAAAGAEIARGLHGTWSAATRHGKAKCPAHADSNASLEIDEANGNTLVHCHAGCSQDDVIAELKARGLWRNGAAKPNGGNGAKRALTPASGVHPIIPVPSDAPPVAYVHPTFGAPAQLWPYHTIAGELAGYAARFATVNKSGEPDKTFRPVTYCKRPGGSLAWMPEGFPEPRPLYRLPELAGNATILVCEGEKAADAAGKLFPEMVATTSMHGAASPSKTDWSPVAGRSVVIWPDADDAGRRYAEDVVVLAEMAGVADVRIVDVPASFPKGWDLADPLPDGWSVEDLLALLRSEIVENDTVEEGGKAIVSARRAALRGDSKDSAIRRIKKQWKDVDAASMVDAAWTWAAERSPGRQIRLDGSKRRIIDMGMMNEQYALLATPDNPACIILRESAMPISRDDFGLRNAPCTALTGVKDSGEAVFTDATKYWIKSDDKHCYRSIVFTSKKTNDPTVMNLFTGFGVEPIPGDCTLILEHIRDVFCAGDEQTYENFINLTAWQFQHVGEPSRIIPTLVQPDQQSGGKNMILEKVYLRAYGPRAGYMTSEMDDIIGTFNAAIRGKSFVFLDEALFAGDHSGADRVKSLATQKTSTVNEKNIPKVAIPSGLNLWLTSNHEIPVKVEEGDARYWFLQPTSHRKGDREYWQALDDQIENGGVSAFLHEMLERNIDGFNPQYDIPRNTTLHKKMVRGNIPIGDPRLWLELSAETGMLMGVEWKETIEEGLHKRTTIRRNRPWKAGEAIASGDLIEGYREWVRGLSGHGKKNVSPAKVWEVLGQAGFERDRGKAGNSRTVPDAEKCENAMKALLGGHSTPG